MNMETHEANWKIEAETAIRVLEWLKLFRDLRRLADVGTPEMVVEMMQKFTAEDVELAQRATLELFKSRFLLEQSHLERVARMPGVRSAIEPDFTDKVKAKILVLAAERGQKFAAEQYGIDPRTIRKWKKKRPD